VAALAWGLNDFLARFPSRAGGPIPTVLVVTLAGFLVLGAWLLLDGGTIRVRARRHGPHLRRVAALAGV
jgi:hypothetical protein